MGRIVAQLRDQPGNRLAAVAQDAGRASQHGLDQSPVQHCEPVVLAVHMFLDQNVL